MDADEIQLRSPDHCPQRLQPDVAGGELDDPQAHLMTLTAPPTRRVGHPTPLDRQSQRECTDRTGLPKDPYLCRDFSLQLPWASQSSFARPRVSGA